jgi:hypothetical protein
MNLDSLFRNEKPLCEFPVSIALCDEAEALPTWI